MCEFLTFSQKDKNDHLSVKVVWFKCLPNLPVTPSADPCLALLSLFQHSLGIPQGSMSGETPYLPEPVSTMIADAKLLKEASTAPIAMASAGSLQYGVERRRSSNTCRWNMAASASRAICHNRGERRRAKPVPQQAHKMEKERSTGGWGVKEES